MTVKVHVKNNRWAEGSFPNTPEGEEVFTITRDRFESALAQHPDVQGRLDTFIDWDTDNWDRSMAEAEVLLTWNLPTEGLAKKAPNLKWIHLHRCRGWSICCRWTGCPRLSP